MTGYERAVEAIEKMDLGLRGTSARCPAHDDRRASLSVREGEGGKALLYCHAGCDYRDVVLALGLSTSDLATNERGQVEADSYVYTDAEGTAVLRVVRVQPKGFYQEHWENGGWQYGGVSDRPLYRLPEVEAASEVYVVEGEKDADLLVRLGLVATTNGGATQAITDAQVQALKGKVVYIVADNDGPGIEKAEAWAVATGGLVVYPRVGKDFTDHYNAGWDVPDLLTERPATSDGIEWLDVDGEDEDIEWLMEPLLPKGAYVTIYGSAGAGKSYIALALAARLAERGVKTTFYSEENPTRVERRRLRKLGGPFTTLRVASQQGVDWGNDEHVRQVCERDRGQDLLLLDSYSVAYSNRTEDENSRAVSFSRVVHRIIRETGATVVVIDHSGFDDSRLRGASAKGQQADVVIHMKESRGGWRGRGEPYEFRLTNEKASRFENPFDLDGALVDTDDGGIKLRWSGTFSVPGWYDMTEQAEAHDPTDKPAAPSAPSTEAGEARSAGASSPLEGPAAPASVEQPISKAELRRAHYEARLAQEAVNAAGLGAE